MRNTPALTVLVFWLILAGLALSYYRGLVADVHVVGQEASNFVEVLQLRSDTVAGSLVGYPAI